MKTIKFRAVALFIVMMSANILPKAFAGDEMNYITISGFVRDAETKKNIEYVNVFLLGTNINTVTNAEGYYSIKILKQNLSSLRLKYSHIGYYNIIKDVRFDNMNVDISLTSYVHEIKEVLVNFSTPEDLVLKAIGKIEDNYPSQANLLTGFYRETIRKRNKYIGISEAIVNAYKTSYNNNVEKDRVEIHKGRRLASQKASDTLSVKFLGGPALTNFLDAVKNRHLIFEKEELAYYRFVLEDYVMIDDKLHYVIDFKPAVRVDYPLFLGKLYIERETLTFSQIEFQYEMSDKEKITEIVLRKRPFGLRFNPKSLVYYVRYTKGANGKSALNYIRTEFDFQCDWKRKLFSTAYSVVSEVVITDINAENIEQIPKQNMFRMNHALSDKIADFSDDDFWKAYNIIEPTESLLSAVNRLKKKNQ
jgi:hypothetical protein